MPRIYVSERAVSAPIWVLNVSDGVCSFSTTQTIRQRVHLSKRGHLTSTNQHESTDMFYCLWVLRILIIGMKLEIKFVQTLIILNKFCLDFKFQLSIFDAEAGLIRGNGLESSDFFGILFSIHKYDCYSRVWLFYKFRLFRIRRNPCWRWTRTRCEKWKWFTPTPTMTVRMFHKKYAGVSRRFLWHWFHSLSFFHIIHLSCSNGLLQSQKYFLLSFFLNTCSL